MKRTKVTNRPPDIEPIIIRSVEKMPVNMYGSDGKWIRTFESQTEAGKHLGVKSSRIFLCINGKSKSCKGYQFRKA